MTKIIFFNSQKGGVSKSTLAQSTAVEATRSKVKTLLADCDPQQKTSYYWAQKRMKNDLQPLLDCQTFNSIEDALNYSKLSDYQLIVIDGPARVSQGTLLAAQKSNLLVQPSGASVADLIPAIKEYNSLSEHVSKDKLFIVLSRIGTKAEYKDAYQYCLDAGHHVFKNYLVEMPSYRQTINEGKAITEVKYDSLRENALNVIQEIVNALSETREGKI